MEKEIQTLEKRIQELETQLEKIQQVVKNIERDIYLDFDEEECSGNCSSCVGCGNEDEEK